MIKGCLGKAETAFSFSLVKIYGNRIKNNDLQIILKNIDINNYERSEFVSEEEEK